MQYSWNAELISLHSILFNKNAISNVLISSAGVAVSSLTYKDKEYLNNYTIYWFNKILYVLIYERLLHCNKNSNSHKICCLISIINFWMYRLSGAMMQEICSFHSYHYKDKVPLPISRTCLKGKWLY